MRKMKDPFDVSDWNESKRHLLEKDIQGPSVAKARKAGWWARKFSSTPGNRSVPDYVFAKTDRRGFYVEFKRPGGTATDLQDEEHKKMRDAGLTVYVCDTRELFDAILATEELFTVRVNNPRMTASEIISRRAQNET